MNSLQYGAPMSNPTEETSEFLTRSTKKYFHSAQTLANHKLSQQHERNSGNASKPRLQTSTTNKERKSEYIDRFSTKFFNI